MAKARRAVNRTIAAALLCHLSCILFLTLVLIVSFVFDFFHCILGLTFRALFIVLYLYCLASFIKHVYSPLKKVEEAMEQLSREEDTDIFRVFEIDSNDSGGALSTHFAELIQLLKESLNREYTADILKKEAELNALQSQINPHFLYNVLDAIRGHALTEGVTEIADMTEALSKLFRYSVSHWESEVTLDRELVNVQNYFKIQQYRFNNKFDLRILIEDNEEDTLSCYIPKLTLQPIIENAIYHGLEMKMDRGLVTIRTKLAEKLLLIEISDDGVGVEPGLLEKINNSFKAWNTIKMKGKETGGSGIALTNVNSRIKMMYGEEYGLYMYSTQNIGSMIEILLPISGQEEKERTESGG
ncbi:sensor histidine kinase [Sediminispirochaeta bajacaliforniensis]|uniref:sensor histidine kinase n=1 Tax=Sediminispirochaeta bajacaliforniensis TaxID=148 RepID=UPI00037DD1D6|nr:histidine kinase [Sediminispirochaeta bajacaliforniensis]